MKLKSAVVAVAVLVSFDVAVSSCGLAEGEVAGLPDWPQFKAATLNESTGEFVVDGDVLVEDEPALRRFYEALRAPGRLEQQSPLTLAATRARDTLYWSKTEAKSLSYCVSPAFGGFKGEVLSSLEAAARDWEQAANIRFRHATAEDGRCSASNPRVLFNVEPVNVSGRYLARAFFPATSRASRNLKVDRSALGRRQQPNLTGIFRHELGHVLGFRHEHTRPEARACFEDRNWVALTRYDPLSVMHYPQCNGGGNSDLKLSPLDVAGARKVYPF